MSAADTGHGAAAPQGRAPSPPAGPLPPPPPPPPPPPSAQQQPPQPSKHSSFYTSSNTMLSDSAMRSTSSYAGSAPPPQTSSFSQGLPSFIERSNSDAFKHNVLPALGPPSRGVPMSPRSSRHSAAMPPMGAPAGPEPNSHHYSHRPGARSSSSSVSSIASGAALAHPPSHREREREASPSAGQTITSKAPSMGPHSRGHHPPGPQLPHSQGPTHDYAGPSAAVATVVSSFSSPPLRGSSSAQTYAYRNGSASSMHPGYSDAPPLLPPHPAQSAGSSYSSGRHLESLSGPHAAQVHKGDHYLSSPHPHTAQISSFGSKGDNGKIYNQAGPSHSRHKTIDNQPQSSRSRHHTEDESRPGAHDDSANAHRTVSLDQAQQHFPQSQQQHESPGGPEADTSQSRGDPDDSACVDAESSAAAAKNGDSAEGSKNGNSSDRKVSCLECRASKVKCTGKTPDNSPCARCQRIGRPCVFENHRRGRRPDNLKFQKLEKSLETVTRAFNDFRKLQEPAGPKASETGKHSKPADAEEPIKKKARRSNNPAANPSAAGPAPAPTSEQTAPEGPMPEGLPGDVSQDANGTRRLSGQVMMGPGPVPGPSGTHPLPPPILEHPNPTELGPPQHDPGHHYGPARDPMGMRRPDWFMSGSGAAPHGPPPPHLPVPAPAPVPGPSNTVAPVPNGVPRTGLVMPADSRCRAITIGAHVPLPDGDLGLDPIVRNVVSTREARDFFDTFMHMQNQYFPLLDPSLHTFEWLRDRSPFLLTVIALITARFTEVGTTLTGRLQNFLDAVLLPEVWQKGSRSVETVQAFTLLAVFHDLPMNASDDRTWQYLSVAYGQAIHLGLNRRVRLPDNASIHDQRMVRNGERCWLNLFLVEVMSAMQLGRRSMFNIDRFIGSSDSWHMHVAALPADRNIVALVQLRRTQIRLYDLFESTIAEPSAGEPALTAYRFDIFIRTCMGELDTWKATWYDSVSWAPHEQGVSREILFAYLAATMLQCVLALRACPDGETATSILRQVSRTAVDGLNVLILFDWPDLVFAINQNVVLASYCAILALRMTTHEKRWRGAGAIDPLYIYDLVDKLVGSLSRPGGTLKRSATALSYASYLDAILDHHQTQYEAAMSNGPGPYVPIKHRRSSELKAQEFEAGPAGVTMIPKHLQTAMPSLALPARPSLFSEMTFFDTFFDDL